MRDAAMPELSRDERARTLFEAAKSVHRFDWYASRAEPDSDAQPLLDRFPSAILAWEAAQLRRDSPGALPRRIVDKDS